MNGKAENTIVQRLSRLAINCETALICMLLTAMIGLAVTQIVLRTFFDGGYLWADPLIRYLVLWTGLLGAAMATSRGSHIALDLAGYLIPTPLQPLVQFICHLFSAVTAGFLTWAAIRFLQSEITYGGPGLFSLPGWVWNLIFPLAFALITIRYGILSIKAAIRTYHGDAHQAAETP